MPPRRFASLPFSLGACALLFAFALPSTAPLAAAPFTFADSDLRELPPSANGRTYLLYIGLPPSYGSQPSRRYPTLYFVDGYWDFALFMPLVGNLRVDGALPETIVVGIGYAGASPDYNALRALDLTPGVDPYTDPTGLRTGRAQQFLSVIASEIVPFIEREYRADPTYRVLAGNSYGGLFTTYAAFERPGLFQGYIASSPSLWWRNRYLSAREAALAATNPAFPARLFLAYASEDHSSIVSSTREFYAQIASHLYPGLSVAIREIEGERHSTLKAESFTRGLRFAFAPIAPTPANAATTARSNFANISTRGVVGTGDDALIAGFVVTGLTPKRMLVRAAGPALAAAGVPGFLADPRFTVQNRAGAVVAENDNWPVTAAMATACAQAGATPFATGSRDASTIVTLPPGLYTVVVSGVANTTGIAVVEAFELP